MAKLLILLLAVYGVSCMPGAPFTKYGLPNVHNEENDLLSVPQQLPGVRNLAEKSLPTKFLEFPEVPNALPGTRNLAEKSQLPLRLPGIKNLEEKAVPESITQKRLPILTPVTDNLKLAAPYPQAGYPEASSVQQPHLQPGLQTPHIESGEELLSEAIPAPAKPTQMFRGSLTIPPGTKLKLEDNRGQYSHGFATPEGTQVQETGRLITTNGGWEYVIAKEGSYSYISPEGIPISVHYVADHNGFRIID